MTAFSGRFAMMLVGGAFLLICVSLSLAPASWVQATLPSGGALTGVAVATLVLSPVIISIGYLATGIVKLMEHVLLVQADHGPSPLMWTGIKSLARAMNPILLF